MEDSDFYQDDFDIYYVSFYIPEGRIVAVYNPEGEIIRTIERFQDTKLPTSVLYTVIKRFPNWAIVNDVYRVTYNQKSGATKTYKIKLKNGDKVMRVKVDDSGEFL